MLSLGPRNKTPPVFSCATVESAILAGNISTVSDANLKTYAANGCMLKTATVPTPIVDDTAIFGW